MMTEPWIPVDPEPSGDDWGYEESPEDEGYALDEEEEE